MRSVTEAATNDDSVSEDETKTSVSEDVEILHFQRSVKLECTTKC